MNSGIAISLFADKGMETRLLCHCEYPGILPKAKHLNGTKLILVATWKGKERETVKG